jgi:hypothetical protein
MITETPIFSDAPDLERRVRSREVDTSWAVAAIGGAEVNHLEAQLLTLIRDYGPLTDDELYLRYQRIGGDRTAQRVRTARVALARPKRGEPLIREASLGRSRLGNAARRWVVA